MRLMEWITFYRRNPSRFVEHYFGIVLHLYQHIILYLMEFVPSFCIVAARSAAKSFLIAIFACKEAILRPGAKIVVASATKKQARLIVSEKIKKELIGTSDYPSNKIFTISNFITFTRLILTLVFLYLFVTDNNRVIAIAIYAVAASTDWMDGQIARMTKTVSWLGKVMDPICDRALLFTGVLGLVVRGELPIWVCVLIIGLSLIHI